MNIDKHSSGTRSHAQPWRSNGAAALLRTRAKDSSIISGTSQQNSAKEQEKTYNHTKREASTPTHSSTTWFTSLKDSGQYEPQPAVTRTPFVRLGSKRVRDQKKQRSHSDPALTYSVGLGFSRPARIKSAFLIRVHRTAVRSRSETEIQYEAKMTDLQLSSRMMTSSGPSRPNQDDKKATGTPFRMGTAVTTNHAHKVTLINKSHKKTTSNSH